ncbi:MAG: sulfate ABC transporter permease subunit CysT [Campylobacteraceae bacterium]
MAFFKKKTSRLPGFGLTLGLSLTYMSILILIPLASIIIYSAQISLEDFKKIITDPQVISAFKVSFSYSLIAALLNVVFGFIIAWVISRYTFFGKRVVDALVDLPFAIPTAVAGISLAVVFSSEGFIGRFIPLNPSTTNVGIIIALMFIGLPFVVRTVQPIIEELDSELEEAASSLGANFYQIFLKVIFPSIFPALLTGFALAFARGLGEYGSVIFIASNKPFFSEIVPLIIVKKAAGHDYVGASVVGVTMLLLAFILLLLINFLQAKIRKSRSSK